MRVRFASVIAAAAFCTTALTSSLAAQAGAASTTSSPPAIVTSNFVCNQGVCAIGPGNKGMAFAAGLIGTGGPTYTGAECNPYIMTVTAGKLPPGLQLSEPICEWEIFGTPTASGTYTFTVQIAPGPNNLGQTVGPDGYQDFSITIGSGTSDRLFLKRAVWTRKFLTVQVFGFDVNNSATYTVFVTATGAKLGSFTEKTPDNGGDGTLLANFRVNPAPASVTVTDSLGGSSTIPVTINNTY